MLKMAEALINNKNLYLEPYVSFVINYYSYLFNYNKFYTHLLCIIAA
jgi:hypothetical protein